MIKDFTDELVEAMEVGRVTKFTTLARDGGLPSAAVSKIKEDSHYHRASKAGLQSSIPRLACKYLNKTGVSGEYAEEVKLVGSMTAIFLQGRKLQATLEELIEQTRKLREQNERKNQSQAAGQAPPSGSPPPGSGQNATRPA